MDWLKKIQKVTGNTLAGAAIDGIIAGDVTEYLDTGCYALNALISGSIFGGFPCGKISGIAGQEATGKSFLMLQAAKQFLESNPKAVVFYFETESALTKDILEEREIDTARLFVIPVVTIQEFRTQATRILDEYVSEDKEKRDPILIILDSLGNLSTIKEIEDMTSGADTKDMTRAQLIKGAFRVLTLKLGAAGVPMLVTNHVYSTMDKYNPLEMGGGSGLKYAGSTIIYLYKRKLADGSIRIGNDMRVKAVKSRMTRENSEVSVAMRYESGLDRYYGLCDIALRCGVFKKDGNRVLLPDGKKVFESVINKNPEEYFTEEVLMLIDGECGKVFKYGQGSSEPLEDLEELETEE